MCMSMLKHPSKRICLVLIAGLLLAACGQADDNNPSSPALTPTPLVNVTYLGVSPAMSYAGIYAAQTKGYFADENLIVQQLYSDHDDALRGQDLVDLVVAGKADFASAGADQLLIARQAGQPVVAIMAIYQRDPTAVLSLGDSGIQRPEDLVGKKIMAWNSENILRLFAAQVGLDLSQVTLVPSEGIDLRGGITMFLTGQVDAVIANSVEVEPPLKALGLGFNALYFYEYGIAMYPNLIFTTEAMIRLHPDVVQQFVNAVVRGTEYAVQNPDAMGEWFAEAYAADLGAGRATSQVEVMRGLVPLINPPSSMIGMMTATTWQFVHDAMVEGGLLEAFEFRQTYTLHFLNAYYTQ